MASDTDLEALSCTAMMDVPRIRPVLDKIADKWTIMILTVLCPHPLPESDPVSGSPGRRVSAQIG